MTHQEKLKLEIESWKQITPTWGTLVNHITQKMRVYNIDYSVFSEEPNVIHYKSVEFDFTGKLIL